MYTNQYRRQGGGNELKRGRMWVALRPVVDATKRIPLMMGG